MISVGSVGSVGYSNETLVQMTNRVESVLLSSFLAMIIPENCKTHG